MVYTERAEDPLYDEVLPVVEGCGLSLVEFTVARHKGSVRVRIVVFKVGGIGVADCSLVHRAVQGRLELAFTGCDVYIEVSSTGIDRTVKDASEFRHYIGVPVRCYLREVSDWVGGMVESADHERLVLAGEDGRRELEYRRIAKAKLDM
ncbi:MAG: ribosome assembly cofactor RimP [Spirochaetaceae bacterium]|nr:ribosome assembly cofactor RimP [Spirochaetaceae bacterium]